VLVGSVGEARSPARRDTDHVGMDLDVRSWAVVPVDRRSEHVVVPMAGPLEVDGAVVPPGALAYLPPGRDELPVRADEPSRAIVLGGRYRPASLVSSTLSRPASDAECRVPGAGYAGRLVARRDAWCDRAMPSRWTMAAMGDAAGTSRFVR
jgi:hypothetical protein